MKEAIYNLIIENEAKKADKEIIEALERVRVFIRRVADESNPDTLEALIEANKAIGKANGYTEYIRQDIALKLNITKTAVKYLVNELTKEDRIEYVKYDKITFLKAKQ